MALSYFNSGDANLSKNVACHLAHRLVIHCQAVRLETFQTQLSETCVCIHGLCANFTEVYDVLGLDDLFVEILIYLHELWNTEVQCRINKSINKTVVA